MKILFLLVACIVATTSIQNLYAQDSRAEKEHRHNEEEKHDHGKEEKHDHDDEDEHEHGHKEGGGKAVGPGKAILEVNEEKGFRLSNEAMTTLGVKFKTVESSSPVINAATLVTSKNTIGVYRYREGFFKFIPVIIKQASKTEYSIETRDLRSGDQIVTDDVGLIAITDVYSTDTAEYSHGH